MARAHSQYVCQQCGYSQVGWAGKCPNCGTWGSLVETIIEETGATKSGMSQDMGSASTVKLSSISSKKLIRLSTKISELDRVLGGGVVSGQVTLLAGIPGIGKSTILLQLANNLGNVLYVCGEESSSQIAIRAQRLGVKSKTIELLENTDIDTAISVAKNHKSLKAVVVDSIQTMSTSDLSGLPGSVGQVRECAYRLVRYAKQSGTPVFIVGHVTKEGTVSGPSVLAHVVDTVLWFEGDKSLTLRLIRANKNRFGPTDEVGIFAMKDTGLEPIANPESLFITKGVSGVAGTIITSIQEGTRPILVEVQSLVVPTKLAFPKRTAQGIDAKRVELILAVLQRRLGLPLYEFDVFVNVAGGVYIKEPGADLAVALSLASSYFDKPLPKNLLALGEVGLLGEIREVSSQAKRVKESRRQGYRFIASSREFKFLNQAVKRLLK